MASPFSEEEIQEKVDQYKREGDWDAEKKEPEKNTERAIRTLAESIVENYDNRAGTDEFSTLLRICQVRTKEETKKRRVDGLSIPDEDKEQIHAYIEEGRGIVGTGMAQISIPDDHEEDAYKLLETLVTSDSQEELDSAIETFASLEIKGVQSGVLSPIIYFLHPSKYPIINGPVEERFEDLLDYEVSRRISDYTSEAEKIREFRDEYGLGGDEGNLRDLDWFRPCLDA